jgi:hypothetical protein
MTMKNAVFQDVTLSGYRKSRRFGATYRLNHQSEWDLRSSKTSVLIRATRHHILEDGVFIFRMYLPKLLEMEGHFQS